MPIDYQTYISAKEAIADISREVPNIPERNEIASIGEEALSAKQLLLSQQIEELPKQIRIVKQYHEQKGFWPGVRRIADYFFMQSAETTQQDIKEKIYHLSYRIKNPLPLPPSELEGSRFTKAAASPEEYSAAKTYIEAVEIPEAPEADALKDMTPENIFQLAKSWNQVKAAIKEARDTVKRSSNPLSFLINIFSSPDAIASQKLATIAKNFATLEVRLNNLRARQPTLPSNSPLELFRKVFPDFPESAFIDFMKNVKYGLKRAGLSEDHSNKTAVEVLQYFQQTNTRALTTLNVLEVILLKNAFQNLHPSILGFSQKEKGLYEKIVGPINIQAKNTFFNEQVFQLKKIPNSANLLHEMVKMQKNNQLPSLADVDLETAIENMTLVEPEKYAEAIERAKLETF